MRPCLIEVGHIRLEDAVELLLLKYQQVIEAFLTNTAQEPLTDGIGSRSVNRRFKQLDATGPRHSAETGSILAVVITDQILRSLPIQGRFSQLLGHPGISWRSCDSDMDHSSCLELDEEEGKERPKEKVSHLQKVTGPNVRRVIAQKCAPLLTSWLLGANRPHVLLDGALADPQA